MNYYKQFAAMLGLELEQEFVLIDADGNRKNKNTYKITEDGVVYKLPTFTNWSINSLGTVGSLLNGDVKAVPKQWKPEENEKYWSYSGTFDRGTRCTWLNSATDLMLWKVGNCFKTKEEAEAKGGEIIEALRKEYEEA